MKQIAGSGLVFKTGTFEHTFRRPSQTPGLMAWRGCPDVIGPTQTPTGEETRQAGGRFECRYLLST